jgi:uncharacterized membrane protein
MKLPFFFKLLLSGLLALIALAAVNLWFSTVVAGGLYYNAVVKAGFSTLGLVAGLYGLYHVNKIFWSKEAK